MLKILALQMLESNVSEMAEDSGTSVTCTGCSCASNVCTSAATQIADIPTLD
jgi:hypothetical protein